MFNLIDARDAALSVSPSTLPGIKVLFRRKTKQRATLLPVPSQSETREIAEQGTIPVPVVAEGQQPGMNGETSTIPTDIAEEETHPITVVATKEPEHTAVEDIADKITLPTGAITTKEPELQRDVKGADIAEKETVKVLAVSAPPREPHTDPIPLKPAKQPRPFYRNISLILLILVLLGLTVPLLMGIGYGISTYNAYLALRTHASSGVHHLLDVKDLFTGPNAHKTTVSEKLQQAKSDFSAAQSDFQQVELLMAHTSAISLLTIYLPQYRSLVTTASAASRMGDDIAQIGVLVSADAITLTPRLQGPLLSDAKTPLITPTDLTRIGTTITAVLPLLDDMQRQIPLLSLNALPASFISATQKAEIEQFLPLLPQVRAMLAQGQNMLSIVGWLLGVGSPRNFLVQTMDRAELRPTGGFTGQYGTLQINGGRVAPFSLQNIALVEYANNTPVANQSAPAQYSSWWPFSDWGLRDSNLSADFPTSAQYAMQQFQLEMHQQVDGVIVFTPFLIEHILQVLGPVQISAYNETITAQNLEDRLHYYQLDNAGIRKEEIIEHVENPEQARKLFTSRVEHAMMDKVRQASFSTLLAIGKEALHNLKTKDLQIYFSNPQLENLLVQYNDAARIDTSTTHDGLYVVQTNVSASKASQYVRTSIQDNVTLDANGGATHVMQMHLDYTQIASVYGLDTYRDYIRVYVPPSAQFLWGDGFDTGQPLCAGPYAACPANGIYSQDQLVCPTGQYNAGASAPMIGDPYTGAWHPLDKIGPPTNFTSDFPGRAMIGGSVVVPKNCNMTVTLSWYVPSIGHGPYTLLVQRQAGTFPEMDVAILPTPGDCTQLQTAGMHFDGIMTEDMSFTAPSVHLNAAQSADCYTQPGV